MDNGGIYDIIPDVSRETVLIWTVQNVIDSVVPLKFKALLAF